jgi:glutaredoxin
MSDVKQLLKEINENNDKKIVVYALDGCPACEELKSKLEKVGVLYENIVMNGNEEMWDKLEEMGGSDFAPQVQVEDYLIKEEEYETVNELLGETLTRMLGRKITIK